MALYSKQEFMSINGVLMEYKWLACLNITKGCVPYWPCLAYRPPLCQMATEGALAFGDVDAIIK